MQEVGFSWKSIEMMVNILNPRRTVPFSLRAKYSLSLEPQSSTGSRISDMVKWLDRTWLPLLGWFLIPMKHTGFCRSWSLI